MATKARPKSTASNVTLHTGRRMPTLGLGTWQLTHETAEVVEHALRVGYRMIDTACDYGSQRGIGEAMMRWGHREDVYLVTKVEENDDAYQATRRYLAEIGVEYTDLMLIHRAPSDGVGAHLWWGLVRARDDGLIRDIGVSNYSTAQLERLCEEVGEMPTVNQIEWSPFGHSQSMLNFCREHGVVIQAYSPLTRTLRLTEGPISEMAQRYGRSPAQVVLRWNLQLGVAPLPKANRKEHLEENIRLFDFEISAQDMATLNALNERYSTFESLQYD